MCLYVALALTHVHALSFYRLRVFVTQSCILICSTYIPNPHLTGTLNFAATLTQRTRKRLTPVEQIFDDDALVPLAVQPIAVPVNPTPLPLVNTSQKLKISEV